MTESNPECQKILAGISAYLDGELDVRGAAKSSGTATVAAAVQRW
jgi:hypothetical protein